ncbi:hypothetical protein BCR36DRAFT_582788 [Piromyces finnis]|uniref:Uncharacterized protein n=1 Tax=Piromyces finnis TaxID=1754191 RepID=A0A1Y1VB71_9FUNG|nr:hypothetical protein BCR36DRAFT_582788 [Piromyces finnis]|eukprot:ORX51744.1 hypothetical protein BCR36DRAFT_582788 [Piromyces finnis]
MQSNNQNPKPEIPPRANNYPIQSNQNMWNNVANARPPPVGGPTVNRPPINNGANPNNRPVPQRNGSAIPNQIQQFPTQNMQRPPMPNQPSIPQRSGNNPQFPSPVKHNSPNQAPILPQQRQNTNQQNIIRNQPTTLPIAQLSNPPPNPVGGNPNNNMQANNNIQQRRTYSQKDIPPPPAPPVFPKKSNSSVSRASSRASSIKSKFVDIVNRSISRKFSTKNDKAKKLNSYGGMNVHSAYRNSLLAKPVFDSKLLLKPQNPNFIFSLGIVFMVASVSLAIAFIVLREGGLTESKIHDISSEDSFGFIFFSVFMLLIGLTGYIAYHKKWTSLLITYSVFLVFGFIVQIIIIFLFLKIYFNPLIQMRYKWIDVLSDAEKQTIQEVYQCCGYLSVVDHGLTTSMCMPDTASTTLTLKTSSAMLNTFNYLDSDAINKLNKRQDTTGAGTANTTDPAQDLKNLYKSKDPNSYTESDIKDEGCARIIVKAIKSGLLQYILIECVMALLFIVAFYFSILHFKEQLKIEKEIDSARATFG